jgi:hypothetical protein
LGENAQKCLISDFDDGKFNRLSARMREDGVIVVGTRADAWRAMSYNHTEVILMPHNHRLSRLYTEFVHCITHSGVATTVSKVRRKYWIIQLQRIAKSIRYHCIPCRKNGRIIREQIMGQLPLDRLKPAPAWHSTSLDYFGPIDIRGEVNKRSRGKSYGLIFNCMQTRAVHVELCPDYSTDKFLLTFRRFIAIRGFPANIYSDKGSQLVSANKEMKAIIVGLDWNTIEDYGASEGVTWHFTPGDSPWENGCSEALIKSLKKSIQHAIGEQTLNYSELLSVLTECANLLNERPIGSHPHSPDDGIYLSPNDLLLGRSTSRIPSGPFKESSNPKKRFQLVQAITNAFWKKWVRDFFPNLIIRQKWHTARRNIQVNDIVLIQDSKLVRGKWRLGKVNQVFCGRDGKVRRVVVGYKQQDENSNMYTGMKYTNVERSVNRIVVLLPADEVDTWFHLSWPECFV